MDVNVIFFARALTITGSPLSAKEIVVELEVGCY
jgi:hypothetical protein